MSSRVVITTIYPPGEAIKKISEKDKLIAVGDKKTPVGWQYPNVRYISVKEQSSLNHRIVEKLPYNHYGRKMIGYLEAIKEGANIIIDTDDDNIPKGNLIFPDFEGEYSTSLEDRGFINIYSWFTDQRIWARGLPLDRINATIGEINKAESKIGVWQGLADGDPDVDAIYRLTNNYPCIFQDKEPIVLEKGTLSPFNSQNTAFRKELFPLLYLPAYVTFRFTDILRGWVAQPLMWAAGYRLGFTNATVVQERNPHDYLKDFESEIPCYLNGNKVIGAVSSVINGSLSIVENLELAYKELFRINIVSANELELLDSWIADIDRLSQ